MQCELSLVPSPPSNTPDQHWTSSRFWSTEGPCPAFGEEGPGTSEVWFLDDEWGYLYVYDAAPQPASPPKHLATVPLFKDVRLPYYRAAQDIKGGGDGYWRWLTFSIDGRWAYPANGAVVDAESRALTTMTITAGEKQVEVGFSKGVPVIVGGQNGGIYRAAETSIP